MGAWGTGPFDTDASHDWLLDYVEEGLPVVVQSFRQMAWYRPWWMDTDVCQRAWVASEAVSDAHGFSHPLLEEDETALAAFALHRTGLESLDLRSEAIRACSQITSAVSGLRRLWFEGPVNDGEVWLSEVSDLQKRLLGSL